MSRSEQKIVQYLKEARADEQALVRVLQSQIAVTPRGTYRDGLEAHLVQTREHASALQDRSRELSRGFDPIALAVGVTGAVVGQAESVVGQALALTKAPLDLVRGSGGEEKVLKNAKDAAAAEALEIATYTALERLAERAGDTRTAELAARIRGEEERMLDRLLALIPELTDAVYAAEVGGSPSYDPTTTGAADAVRGAAGAVRSAASTAASEVADAATKAKDEAADAATKAKDEAADAATKVRDEATEAASTAKDTAKQAAAEVRETAGDVARAAEQQAADVVETTREKAEDAADEARSAAKDAKEQAQDVVEDAKTEAEEASAAKPSRPVAAPGTPAPWASYDESTDEEILAVLLTADQDTLVEVGAYERAHQARKSILSNVDHRTPAPS